MGLGKGNGKGGRRAQAGRPKGARGKTVLERLADKNLPAEYRDKLAAMAAPYCSPRLTSVAVTKRPAQMSDEEVAEMIGLTREDMLRLGIGRGEWPRQVH